MDDIKLFCDGRQVRAEMLTTVKAGELYNINRTAQIIESSVITLKIKLKTDNPQDVDAVILVKRAIE